MDGQKEVSFVGVLEPHGLYDGRAETVTGATSGVASIRQARGDDATVVVLTLLSGKRLVLGVADDPAEDRSHTVSADGQTYQWTGAWARLDR